MLNNRKFRHVPPKANLTMIKLSPMNMDLQEDKKLDFPRLELLQEEKGGEHLEAKEGRVDKAGSENSKKIRTGAEFVKSRARIRGAARARKEGKGMEVKGQIMIHSMSSRRSSSISTFFTSFFLAGLRPWSYKN